MKSIQKSRKKFRDQITHPRKEEDVFEIEEYRRRVRQGITAIIDASTSRANELDSLKTVDWNGKVCLIEAAEAAFRDSIAASASIVNGNVFGLFLIIRTSAHEDAAQRYNKEILKMMKY